MSYLKVAAQYLTTMQGWVLSCSPKIFIIFCAKGYFSLEAIDLDTAI